MSYFGKCFDQGIESGALNLNFFFGVISSSGGISGSISAVGWGSSCPGVVEGVDDVADVVDGVADVVDGVTFVASHAAFSALVSFCPGSYCFHVSPSYNFLGATWNSSEINELLSLLLNKCLCRTVWIIAARQWVGCLGGRTANVRWNGLGEHWFMLISSLVSSGVKHNFENFKSAGLHRHGGSEICTKGHKECS